MKKSKGTSLLDILSYALVVTITLPTAAVVMAYEALEVPVREEDVLGALRLGSTKTFAEIRKAMLKARGRPGYVREGDLRRRLRLAIDKKLVAMDYDVVTFGGIVNVAIERYRLTQEGVRYEMGVRSALQRRVDVPVNGVS